MNCIMFEDFPQSPSFASSDNGDMLRVRVRKHGRMNQSLVGFLVVAERAHQISIQKHRALRRDKLRGFPPRITFLEAMLDAIFMGWTVIKLSRNEERDVLEKKN